MARARVPLVAIGLGALGLLVGCAGKAKSTQDAAAPAASPAPIDEEDPEALARQLEEYEAGLRGAEVRIEETEDATQDAGGEEMATPSRDGDRCARVCDLATAICELEDRVCALAERHPGEARYAEVCARADRDCAAASRACDGCGDG